MNRADVNLDQVGGFVFDLYGLTLIEIKCLNGYDDKNFHVFVNGTINDNPFIDAVADHGYVLKIINTLDSQEDKFEAQKLLLYHLIYFQASRCLISWSMNRADVNLDQVGGFMFDLYGLTSIDIKCLNGYDDKNFHVFVNGNINDNPFIDAVADHGYVLKIINTLDSQEHKFEAQKLLLYHLKERGILCPKPVVNKKGKVYEKIKLSSGVHILWLLQYIDGIILHKVPKSCDLFYGVGVLAANIDNALKDFDHPVYHTRIQWSLGSAEDVISYVYAINCEEKTKLVRSIISEFSSRVLSVESELEKGIIHGDLNEQNILVDKENLKIKAVIDFGDTHYGCYLYELALAMVYMIFTSNDINSGRYVLNGYNSVRRICPKEFKLLKICVLTRFCQSLVYGAYGSLQDPTNDYILTTSKTGWNLLETIYDFPENDLLNLWGIDLNL